MFEQYKDVFNNFGTYSKNIFRKDYFSWLFSHMRTWSKFSWGLIVANFIIQIVLAYEGFGRVPVYQTILGFLGANLSVCCVVGVSNRAPIQGWFGLTSALCIASSGFLAGNFADGTLQIGYIIFLDLFCILSPKWNDNVTATKVKGLSEWIGYAAFFLVAWAIVYFIYGKLNDPRLLLDSATLAISLTGALMQFNLKREQYYIWTLTSIITLALWVQTAMMGDANYALVASYAVFLLNDIFAFTSKKAGWFRGFKEQQNN